MRVLWLEGAELGDVNSVVPFPRTGGRRAAEPVGHVQKMEALGQITGGIAHELNNMLLAISLNLEALHEELPAVSATQPMFDGAQQSIDQAKDLIVQLLAFSRRQPLEAGDFDVNRAVRETRLLLRLVLPANIEIETRLSPQVVSVFADRAEFEIALVNLALNAGDAMPQGGRLTITTARSGGNAAISVSDTGLGIPPEIAARAFEPFFTTKAAQGRSGLGLSQVYGYAKQSGGFVELDSGPSGTTVRLLLPGTSATLAPASPPIPRAGPGEAVLMVEDAPLVRQAVARMLGDLGYEVLVAGDAEEALIFIESARRIDILFTDVMLPGSLAGDELATVARRLRPGLRVLYTSGYSELRLEALANDNGGFELLSKPYTKIELARRLHGVLDAN
jgi:CheY-like chemotaxis protein